MKLTETPSLLEKISCSIFLVWEFPPEPDESPQPEITSKNNNIEIN
jgi:hypothetical protein